MLIFLLKLFISLGQCFLFVCEWKRPKSNKHRKSTNLRIEVFFTEREKCDKNKCFLFPMVFLRENRHKYVFLFIVHLSKLGRQHWRGRWSIRVQYTPGIFVIREVTPPLKETKTVLDADVVDSRFQVVDPGSLSGELEFRVPCAVFCNSKPSIPDFWLHKQNFPDFEIRILLYGARRDISGRSRPLHWPEMSPTFSKRGVLVFLLFCSVFCCHPFRRI